MRAGARYLAILAAAVVALALGYAALFEWQLGAPVAAEYWVRDAWIAKLGAARAISGPKIAIVGGSNALFGLDSAAIERATGRPTVNLSLHGGLSLDYLLDSARRVLQPGDVVILSLEYGYYESVDPSPSWFSSNVMAWDPGYVRGLSLVERIDFLLSTPAKRVLNGALARLFAERLRRERGRALAPPDAVLAEARALWAAADARPPAPLYSFRNLSPRGDIRQNAGWHYTDDPDALPAPTFTYRAAPWERLQAFAAECRRRGIRVFLSWPSVPSRLGKNEPAVRRYFAAIRDEAARRGLAALGQPADFLLAPPAFFNSLYHLNEEGRAARTARVLRELEPRL